MINVTTKIDKLTCREKELFIYYVTEGISKNSKNNYIACMEVSRSYLNQLTHNLKIKGFLIRTEEGILKINN